MMTYLLPIILSFLLMDADSSIISRNFESFAFDTETKEYLYKEVHSEELLNNKLRKSRTDYIDKDDLKVASRLLTFSDDLSKPNFKIEHFELDYYEGAELLDSNRVRVYKKMRGTEVEEEKVFEFDGDFVIDAGLNHYFRDNWDTLLSGETKQFYFIAPSQLDYFNFQVYKNDIIEINGREGMELVLEPNSFFLRLFFSSIYITYALDTKEILYYKGISNIYDKNAEIYDVVVDFTLEEPTWKD